MVHFVFLLAALHLTVTGFNQDASVGFNDTDIEYTYASTCVELFNPKVIEFGCCKLMELVAQSMHACKKWGTPWTCDDSICMLDMYGLMDGDQVNEMKVRDLVTQMERYLKHPTNFLRRIGQLCMGGRYGTYAPDVDCPPLKYQICIFANAVVYETSWKQSPYCEYIHQLVKRCKLLLDGMDREMSEKIELRT